MKLSSKEAIRVRQHEPGSVDTGHIESIPEALMHAAQQLAQQVGTDDAAMAQEISACITDLESATQPAQLNAINERLEDLATRVAARAPATVRAEDVPTEQLRNVFLQTFQESGRTLYDFDADPEGHIYSAERRAAMHRHEQQPYQFKAGDKPWSFALEHSGRRSSVAQRVKLVAKRGGSRLPKMDLGYTSVAEAKELVSLLDSLSDDEMIAATSPLSWRFTTEGLRGSDFRPEAFLAWGYRVMKQPVVKAVALTAAVYTGLALFSVVAKANGLRTSWLKAADLLGSLLPGSRASTAAKLVSAARLGLDFAPLAGPIATGIGLSAYFTREVLRKRDAAREVGSEIGARMMRTLRLLQWRNTARQAVPSVDELPADLVRRYEGKLGGRGAVETALQTVSQTIAEMKDPKDQSSGEKANAVRFGEHEESDPVTDGARHHGMRLLAAASGEPLSARLLPHPDGDGRVDLYLPHGDPPLVENASFALTAAGPSPELTSALEGELRSVEPE